MPDPVVPRLAATLLLLRDGAAGLEVLMTLRHEKSGFAAGALVFPGGKLDPGDLLLRDRADPAEAEDPLLDYRIAAIRETFEETGILLARTAEGTFLARGGLAALQRHHEAAEAPLAFGAILDAARLRLATDLLTPFAHWITPVDRPQRFDTHFFVAPAPEGQDAVHDGHEIVDARWTTPTAALAEAAAGRIKLVFATHMNLVKLARCATAADVLARAAREEIIAITPEILRGAAGPILRIPAAAGYELTELPAGITLRP